MRARRWTVEETQDLLRLQAEGYVVPVIAEKMGRTTISVRERIRWLGKTEEQREIRRKQISVTRKGRSAVAAFDHPVMTNKRAPDERIAEREYRLALPRTLTGQYFGDPPPGYSALDRKRQGLPV
jgi:hypothetical protein